MKKAVSLTLKIFAGFLFLLIIGLFTIPVIFKDKIRTRVEQAIDESVNAKVRFEDYNLGFFRNFPDLSFSMQDLSITGVNEFSEDTLAGFRSFDILFNAASIFKKTGYEVKSVIIEDAVVNAIILKDGSANWDIVKDTTTSEETADSGSDMLIRLNEVEIKNSRISYTDYESDMQAILQNVNFSLNGDMTTGTTNLDMIINADELSYIMEGTKYLNKAKLASRINLFADLDSMRFTFGENEVALNDFRLNFSGTVRMPDNDIITDLAFSTPGTSFKTLLSLVPAVYMDDYKDINATGEFMVNGTAKGVYSDADSTLPDISIDMSINNGLLSYPELPEKIRNINVQASAFVDGKDLDKTTFDMPEFNFELAGNPFDMTFSLRTPMSDPAFEGSMTGQIDLAALSRAIPMDSIRMSGLISMSLEMAGSMSMIEKEQYQDFTAMGNMKVRDMLLLMTGYPEVKITDGSFAFSPAFSTMTNTKIIVGEKSDFVLTGRLENYIKYILDDGVLKGTMSMRSDVIDMGEIMAGMAVESSEVEDTGSLAVIRIPENIDFTFDAGIKEFSYENIVASDVKGSLIVRDGVLSIRDAAMNILDGVIQMNADYDTRDSLKPSMKADFNMKNIDIKQAFNSFNTVKLLAPVAGAMEGKVTARLDYSSLLAQDMMPVVRTINGAGRLQTDQVTLVGAKSFEKIRNVLNLNDDKTNVIRNVNVSFKLAEGRVYVTPFDVKAGNLKMNISGDQGLDQTLNYIVKTEIPRSDLGSSVNSVINNLTSQAASLGIRYQPSDVIKVNMKVGGTFNDPQVSPVFGSSGETSGTLTQSAKETAKETVGNAIDEGKAKARTEAEEQGAKLVRDAEERAAQIRDEADKAAENIRKEAASQAQNIIDAAESKGTLAKVAAQRSADQINKTAATKADQLVQQADISANKLVEEAKANSQAMIDKLD